jgi:hypothetical protein
MLQSFHLPTVCDNNMVEEKTCEAGVTSVPPEIMYDGMS